MTACERCGSEENVESVEVYGGRDHPPRPPEFRDLCGDCRDEHEPEPVEEPV